jgi:hypothetical protein
MPRMSMPACMSTAELTFVALYSENVPSPAARSRIRIAGLMPIASCHFRTRAESVLTLAASARRTRRSVGGQGGSAVNPRHIAGLRRPTESVKALASVLMAGGCLGRGMGCRGRVGQVAADGGAAAKDSGLRVSGVTGDHGTDARGHLLAVAEDVADEAPCDPVVDADGLALPAAVAESALEDSPQAGKPGRPRKITVSAAPRRIGRVEA